MHPLLPENLISTKDASDISGYNSDYLARLCRAKKIDGKQIGRTWLIDRNSLARFIALQKERKHELADALARTRENEYRDAQPVRVNVSQATGQGVKLPLQKLPARVTLLGAEDVRPVGIPLFSRVAAALLALGIVGAGAYGAHAAATGFANAEDRIATVIEDARDGFDSLAAPLVTHLADRIALARESGQIARERAARSMQMRTDALAPVALTDPHLIRLETPAYANGSFASAVATDREISERDIPSAHLELSRLSTELGAAMRSPGKTLAGLYFSVGEYIYGAEKGSIAAYLVLIQRAGDSALAFGSGARDRIALAPAFVRAVNLGLGDAVIAFAHAAIRADIAFAYWAPAAAETSARTTTLAIGNTGAYLAYAAGVQAPRAAYALGSGAYTGSIALGEASARGFFGAEYAAATRFVALTDALRQNEMLAIYGAGGALRGAAIALANPAFPSHIASRLAVPDLFAVLGARTEDSVLGFMGHVALTADALSLPMPVQQWGSSLAAATEAKLNLGQEIALGTYDFLHGIWSGATGAIADFVSPGSVQVVENFTVENAVTKQPQSNAVASSTPPAPGTSGTKIVYTGAPTYNTTIVQKGTSQSYVDSAIAAAKAELAGTIATMFAANSKSTTQVINNFSTSVAQMGNIGTLSNVILHSPVIDGAQISSSNFSGASVSATNGSFATLSAGTTTLSGPINATAFLLNGVPFSGGGGAGLFSTTSNSLALYPTTSTQELILGASATTTTGNILEAHGNAYVSGALTLGAPLAIGSGGTGTSTVPTANSLLLSDAAGNWEYVATSSLGIQSATWGNITGTLAAQTDLSSALASKFDAANYGSSFYNLFHATTTDALAEGSTNLYYTPARVNGILSATTSLPNITTLASLALPFSQLTGVPLAVSTTTANSWSALQRFANASSTNFSALVAAFGSTGTTTINAAGALSTPSLLVSNLANCTGSQALQTDVNGNLSCGTLATGGASSGGGWITNNIGSLTLSTTTDRVAIGASSTPYAKLSIISSNAATTTLALVPASGQTANILDIYGTSGSLMGSLSSAGLLSIPSLKLGSLDGVIAGTAGTLYAAATTTLVAGSNLSFSGGTPVIFGSTPITVSASGNVATSSGETSGQLPYWTTTNGTPAKLGSIATSTPTIGSILTYSGTLGNLIGGTSGTFGIASGAISDAMLASTFLKTITANYPLTGLGTSGSPLSLAFGTTTSNTWGGLQTFANAPILGSLTGLIYGNSGALSAAATTTLVAGSNLSFSGGTPVILGSTPITLNVSSSGNVATSSLETAGQIPFWTTTGGTPALLSGGSRNFVWDSANNRLGIGTTSPFASLAVNGQFNATAPLFVLATTTLTGSSTALVADASGNLSLLNGTSFTISSLGRAAGAFLAADASGKLIATTTSSIGLINAGAQGQVPFYNAAGNTLSATSSIFIAQSGNIGIGTSTPARHLDIANSDGLSQILLEDVSAATAANAHYGGLKFFNGDFSVNTMSDALSLTQRFLIASSTGNVGIGTGAPAFKLDVAGGINTDQYSGFYQGGNLLAYASSTNSSTLFGLGVGGGISTKAGTAGITAIGASALASTVSAEGTVAIGDNALHFVTTATSSVAIGSFAGYGTGFPQNLTGEVLIGTLTGGGLLTNANYNTLIGYQAGYNLTSGNDNIILGATTNPGGNHIQTGSNNILIGFNAASPTTATNNFLNIGNIIFGTSITATSSSTSIPTTLTGNIGIGTSAPGSKLDVAGFINTDRFSGYRMNGNLLGYASTTNQATIFGLGAGGQSATTSATVNSATAFGYLAMSGNTTGGANTAVGTQALSVNKTGSSNVAVGFQALGFATGGSSNSAVGVQSMLGNSIGVSNAAFGYQSLENNLTGSSNVAVGAGAMANPSDSTSTVAVGASAGLGFGSHNQGSVYVGATAGYNNNNNADYNTYLGYQSGYLGTTGFDNILLGAQPNNVGTGYLTTAGDSIGIGFNTRFASTTANNQLNIGNLVFGTLPATTTASSLLLPTTGNIGIGATTSALLGLHANNGATYLNLFSIASSTATATTSLLTLNNSGVLQLSKLGTAAGTFLAADASGNLIATSTLTLATISGTLAVPSGGTGQTSFTAGNLIYGAGSGALQSIATSSISVGSGISVTSGTLGSQVGGTNVTLGIANAAITNAMLANSTISGIALGSSLAAHTHDATLTGTSYNGSTAVSDWGLNLANANTWSALQQFTGNASTTQFTSTGNTYLATAGGSVGIGTTSPFAMLAVNGQFNATKPLFALATTTLTGSSTALMVDASGNLSLLSGAGLSISKFATPAGTFLAADTNGNIIATSTPSGSGSGTVGSGTIGQIPFYNAAGTTLTATSSLFLAQSGNVGIGTTSPYASLSLMAGGNYASQPQSTVFAIGSSTAGTATSTLLTLDSAGTFTVGNGNSIAQGGITKMLFNGRLGINVTPDSQTMIDGAENGNSNTDIRVTNIYGSGAGALASAGFQAAASGAVGAANNNTLIMRAYAIANTGTTFGISNAGIGAITVNATSSALAIGTLGAKPIVFGTNNVEAMRIMSGGNVGIGTTSPYADLSVMAGGNYASQAASTIFAIGSSTAGTATSTLLSVMSTGNIGIGTTTPSYPLDVAGYINTDAYSGYKMGGNTVLYASTTNTSIALGAPSAAAWMTNKATAFYDVAIGQTALATVPTNTSPINNVAIGYDALNKNTNGAGNVAIGGRLVLGANTIGSNNVGIGYNVLNANIGGSGLTAIGGTNMTGNSSGGTSVAIGYGTLQWWADGSQTTAVGYQAGGGNSGSYNNWGNVLMGYQSGFLSKDSANNNVLIGDSAGYNLVSGANNIIIGAYVDAPSTTGNQQLNIGNILYGTGIYNTGSMSSAPVSAGKIGIGTSTPVRRLDIANTDGLAQIMLEDVRGTTAANMHYGSFKFSNGDFYLDTLTDALVSTPRFMIASTTGAVGINNTASDDMLSVKGNGTNHLFEAYDSVGATQFIVTNLGTVGVGTSTPKGKLAVALSTDADNAFTISNAIGSTTLSASTLDTAGTIFSVASSTGATDYFDIMAAGNVGIGTTSPGTLLQVGGGAVTDGNQVTIADANGTCTLNPGSGASWACTSDARLKNSIQDAVENGLSYADSFRIRDFKMNADGSAHVGVIAQEVLTNHPELVTTLSDGTYAVEQPNNWLMVKAIQELDQRTSWIALAGSSAATTSSPALTLDQASGNVGLGTVSPRAKLEIAGDVLATSYEASAATPLSYSTGSTTVTATLPPEVLTAGGAVDLYKLATYDLSGVTALASRLGNDEVRMDSLADRISKLESGAVSTSSGNPFSTSTLASALEGFGVFIQNGLAQFGTLVADQFVAATNSAGTSSAGTVVIPAGNTVALVTNAYVSPTAKIFVTFTATTTGSWYVSDKAAGSFRVILSAPQSADVSFDYFIVETSGQVATSTPSGAAPTTASGAPLPTNIPPQIVLLGANPLYISVGAAYVDPGVTVTDAYDGTVPVQYAIDGAAVTDLSQFDTSVAAERIITYTAQDSKGNIASTHRAVVVGTPTGTTPPPAPPATTTPPIIPAPATATSTADATATSTASSTTP